MNQQKYQFYTHPITEFSSVENQCMENDFPINNPIDFNNYNQTNAAEYSDCMDLIRLLNVEDPEKKLNPEVYANIKKRVFDDFSRLSDFLNKLNLKIKNTLFISIGNSMESYGFILNKVFPDLKMGHIKVSRTLKDNVENYCGKQKKDEVFNEYFQQRVGAFLQRYSGIETVIFIDTFGAGETTSTIFYSFMQNGIEGFEEIQIFTAVLLEAGHLKPTPPYDNNLKLYHLPVADNLLQNLADFRMKKTEIMPVLTFNENFTTREVKYAIENYKTDERNTNKNITGRFRVKDLKIFLELQRIKFNEQDDFIIVPSRTTRLLYPVNPYITVTQKTVFLVKDIETGNLISRDGFGLSRKECPPMMLHRLNNKSTFNNLSLLEKCRFLLENNNQNIEEATNVILNDSDVELIRNSFESLLRKKIIYYLIAGYESEVNN